jgi:hypothetical protein
MAKTIALDSRRPHFSFIYSCWRMHWPLLLLLLTQTLHRDVNIFTLSTHGGGGCAVF